MTTTVLITGGSGNIATAIRPFLHEAGWTVRLLDTVAPAVALSSNESAYVGSLFDAELLAEACDGVGLVVHLAAHPVEREWADILSLNIDGTQRVFTAAAAAGVRRVLYASTVHAVGFYPFSELRDAETLLPRPDTYYGVSKAAGEAIGAVFADRYRMSVVSARIVNASMNLHESGWRIFWFSPADMARLVIATAALEEPGHHIVWGVSLGAERWVPLEAGRRIGFDPKDDATTPEDRELDLEGLCGTSFTELPLGETWWGVGAGNDGDTA